MAAPCRGGVFQSFAVVDQFGLDAGGLGGRRLYGRHFALILERLGKFVDQRELGWRLVRQGGLLVTRQRPLGGRRDNVFPDCVASEVPLWLRNRRLFNDGGHGQHDDPDLSAAADTLDEDAALRDRQFDMSAQQCVSARLRDLSAGEQSQE